MTGGLRRAGMAAVGLFFKALEAKRRLLQGEDPSAAPAGRLYGFEARSSDGAPARLERYRGRVLLIVNTASLCGFTPQYEGLEELGRRFGPRGLSVLAFPSNDFGRQEPGTDEEVRTFCRSRFGLSFDLFSKISVRGEEAHPLYRWLTRESGFPGEVPWNFTKFVADREGRVVARYGPDTEPLDGGLVSLLERLL